MFLQSSLDDDIRRWLLEDVPNWDPHTSSIDKEKVAKAKIVAKQNGVISGVSVLKRVFELCNVTVTNLMEDGAQVKNGDIIFRLDGNSNAILQAERTALNIFTHMSGISTITSQIVGKIRQSGSKTKIAATRKTLPGLRKYQKYAVSCGGGDTHRMNLESMIMLKENHISQFNSIKEAIQVYKANSSFSLKIEIEVRTLDEAVEAAQENVDIILLDNFSLDSLHETVSKIKSISSDILIEISGGITLENIDQYLDYPVDIISSGSLTHSSNVFDASLLFEGLI